jgi:hypothetical protein
VAILFGFVYGLIFAGISYQDPTLEMPASYDFHLRVSNIILLIGFGPLLIGFVSVVAKLLLKKRCKIERSHQ